MKPEQTPAQSNAMDAAKLLMTRAAEATMRNDPCAVFIATDALAALRAATLSADTHDTNEGKML